MDSGSGRPEQGIAVDAAHSEKNGVTEYQAIDLATGEQILYRNLGKQTVNIGEFLGVVACVKHIMETGFEPPIIYTDSMTAISWFNNKSTASNKKNRELQKSEVFLKVFAADVDKIEVKHWNNKQWGETPADFNRK